MESAGVLLPLFHHHPMIPWNDLRKGDCCERFEVISNGYFCKSCNFFVHKKCGDSSESIQHPSHSIHTLHLRMSFGSYYCALCGKSIKGLFYRCEICNFYLDLHCTNYPPPDVIETSETHQHKLTLLKKKIKFVCGADCGKFGDEFPYKCHECHLAFHVDCVWTPSPESEPEPEPEPEVHPSKLLTGQQEGTYAFGKCLLCGKEIDNGSMFVCASCSSFHTSTFSIYLFYLLLLLLFLSPSIIKSAEIDTIFFYLLLLILSLVLLYLLFVLLHHLFTLIMDSEGISLPLFHHHRMIPWNDLRKGDCCGRFEAICDGYYCASCDFYVHKNCGDESSVSIEHPSHSIHPLLFQRGRCICSLCGRISKDSYYHCNTCDFSVDIYCARYPPPEVIDSSKTHHHKLTLVKNRMEFDCDAKCGKIAKEFSYNCHGCDLSFHVDCVWSPSEVNLPPEVNHSYHGLHPLKLLQGQPLNYSDGKCRLCGGKNDDEPLYHCSYCNFNLDMRCVLHPRPQSLLNLRAHDHELTLLPRLDSFTCNACGLKGDRSPYICAPCGFMIHQECLALPRCININRHDHRISRTSVLGVLNSQCGVCRREVDGTCGGYLCQLCSGYAVHSKCATRDDVWNGKELEGIPEETEDIEPYVVIDDTTIQHFSHKEHILKLHAKGVVYENKLCRACTHPISLKSFYGCIDCDFILHKSCAKSPKRKWHVLHNERLTLVTSRQTFMCVACRRLSNGFMYEHEGQKFDILCGSISEPFVHPSHSHHSLYYTSTEGDKVCNGCNRWGFSMLRCLENDCEFFICFECATLPKVVKHRVDDHLLSLCYGEEATGIYWCDICEKKINPKKWFYTSEDDQASLHVECVLGDSLGLRPRSTIELWGISYEVVLNNSVSRPICRKCKSHCMNPFMLKMEGMSGTYFCSFRCTELGTQEV